MYIHLNRDKGRICYAIQTPECMLPNQYRFGQMRHKNAYSTNTSHDSQNSLHNFLTETKVLMYILLYVPAHLLLSLKVDLNLSTMLSYTLIIFPFKPNKFVIN